MPRTPFTLGEYRMICDICGLSHLSSQMRKAWDGSWRDDRCFEIRQPQDFVRGIKDNPSVPVGRPFVYNFVNANEDTTIIGGHQLGENDDAL